VYRGNSPKFAFINLLPKSLSRLIISINCGRMDWAAGKTQGKAGKSSRFSEPLMTCFLSSSHCPSSRYGILFELTWKENMFSLLRFSQWLPWMPSLIYQWQTFCNGKYYFAPFPTNGSGPRILGLCRRLIFITKAEGHSDAFYFCQWAVTERLFNYVFRLPGPQTAFLQFKYLPHNIFTRHFSIKISPFSG